MSSPSTNNPCTFFKLARIHSPHSSSTYQGTEVRKRPHELLGYGNSSGMSASSSPIIQTPPSAPLGPSSPEDRNLAKLSWVDEVEGYYNIDISRLSLLLTRSLHATLLVDLSTRRFLERGGSEFS